MKKEELAAKLPLMKCPKYRWWKDEVEAMRSKSSNFHANKSDVDVVDDDENGKKILEATGERSGCVSEKLPVEKIEAIIVTGEEEKVVMSCPVCRSFTATNVNAVNAHIDDCLAQTTSKVDHQRLQMRESTETPAAVTTKVKSRTRKRRSIMEIFAVSPQIEAVKLDCENRHVVVPEEEVDLKVLEKASSGVVGMKKKREKINKNCLRDDPGMMTLKVKNKYFSFFF
ncbi:uncharacterized protein LOC122083498 [Macadamia integrifolia]|uniref:uncharacterized protein LOC122083498 n=1 Tax=Macadamia integrifolia TaxID=60698 RepID=UPI001C4EB832|nr:uncharacterized protein LOC122083498 [Macadamia integrifolia]